MSEVKYLETHSHVHSTHPFAELISHDGQRPRGLGGERLCLWFRQGMLITKASMCTCALQDI